MNMKKVLALALALVLIVGATVAGTVAWLMDTSSEVENVFTTSDIGVGLEESKEDFQMIPGFVIDKDPEAWITEGSVDAYLFVKVQESTNFDEFMTYEIAIDEGWTLLPGYNGTEVEYVIYREVTGDDIGDKFGILVDDQVVVKGEVTKGMMRADDFTEPTLTFTAYAHQLYSTNGKEFTPAAAWANLNP